MSNPTAIHIAVHVRQGDIEPMTRNDKWTGDNKQVIALIEMAKHYVDIVCRSIDVEVHPFLFNERIKRHMATSLMKLQDAQLTVSGEYEKCSVCHPAQCSSPIAQYNCTIDIGNGWQFSVYE